MVIGLVTPFNPFEDRKAWSGIIFKVREAIEQAGFDLVWIPYNNRPFIEILLRIVNKIVRVLPFGKEILLGPHHPYIAKLYAESVNEDLVNDVDYLFFPGGAQISLFMKTEKPVIYFADASVYVMIDYYWPNISKTSQRRAKELEERACKKAAMNIRTSQWALNSVIKDCGCDPKKCYVMEFGYNLDKHDIQPIEPYKSGPLRLLFSGVDWERKGGQIALETLELLRSKGVDAYLTIVGPKQCPSECEREDVDFVGFLNKNSQEDYYKYIGIMRQSHLLILPTRAECAGIVFSEAAAFGMPAYIYDTGGTSNYVINDVNGYAFPLSATAADFAIRIYDDISNGKMSVYRDNSLKLSSEKLSWDVWSSKFKRLMCD